MRLRDHPHIARQYRTQLLQSVAITSAPDTSPPPFREIVDLVSNGYGNEAVRSVHHRAHRIYPLVSGQSHDPILTAVRTAEPGEIMH